MKIDDFHHESDATLAPLQYFHTLEPKPYITLPSNFIKVFLFFSKKETPIFHFYSNDSHLLIKKFTTHIMYAPHTQRIPKFKEKYAHVIHTWSHETQPKSCTQRYHWVRIFLLSSNRVAQFGTCSLVNPVLSVTTMFRWSFNGMWATSRVLVAHNTVKNFKRW